MAVTPKEAYTTPCSPADCTKSFRSDGRGFAGAAVMGPMLTRCGDMGAAGMVAQSEENNTSGACLFDFL